MHAGKQVSHRMPLGLLVFNICNVYTDPCEKGTYMYQIGDQRNLRRACASAQSRRSFRCSHTQYLELKEVSDEDPCLWPY